MSTPAFGRRGFLRFSSIFPVSALTAASTQAHTSETFCAEPPEHPEVDEKDAEFKEASTALWNEFVAGANSLGTGPTIPEETKEHIFRLHSIILRRKVRFWTLCDEETRLCGFTAGVVSEAARLAAGDDKLLPEHFKYAKPAVQSIQTRRLGKAVVGIAC